MREINPSFLTMLNGLWDWLSVSDPAHGGMCLEKNIIVLRLQFIPPVQTYSPLPYFQSLLNFVFVSLHQCIVIFCSGLHLMSKWMEQWNAWIHIPTILFQAIYKCRKTEPYWFMLQRKPSKTFRNILKQNLESRESKYTEWTLSIHQVH